MSQENDGHEEDEMLVERGDEQHAVIITTEKNGKEDVLGYGRDMNIDGDIITGKEYRQILKDVFGEMNIDESDLMKLDADHSSLAGDQDLKFIMQFNERMQDSSYREGRKKEIEKEFKKFIEQYPPSID